MHAAALWLWHLPAWFDAALARNGVHALQHASFLFSALLFWWSVLGPATRAAHGTALASVFTTMLHTGALGALLALSPVAWYAYAATTAFGRMPSSWTRRAKTSSRGYAHASASVVTRFAPADSPAKTTRSRSPFQRFAFSATQPSAAHTSSTAAGNGCSGASR